MDLYAFFQSEVKPTIGCTEPGAVAYAAAVAARHLPTQPEGIRLEMSVAIYKNGRSVGIPGTNGLRGLTLACVLGALGGNPDKGLMALEDIPADTVEQAQAFIDAGKMAEEVVQGTPSMWARVTLSGGGHTVSCTVARKHDHVERLVADGAVLVDQPLEAQSGGTDWTDELTAMHFEELWNLALGIDDAIVRQMLEGARMNMAILDHAGTEQASIGSALAKHNGHGSLSDKIKEVAGAASDLRMSGGDVAVMSSAGSGNHGIVAVIPVAMTARELAAITLVGTLLGMICDGAKESCGLKVSNAASEAWSAAMLALENRGIRNTQGIISPDIHELGITLREFNEKIFSAADSVMIGLMTRQNRSAESRA